MNTATVYWQCYLCHSWESTASVKPRCRKTSHARIASAPSNGNLIQFCCLVCSIEQPTIYTWEKNADQDWKTLILDHEEKEHHTNSIDQWSNNENYAQQLNDVIQKLKSSAPNTPAQSNKKVAPKSAPGGMNNNLDKSTTESSPSILTSSMSVPRSSTNNGATQRGSTSPTHGTSTSRGSVLSTKSEINNPESNNTAGWIYLFRVPIQIQTADPNIPPLCVIKVGKAGHQVKMRISTEVQTLRSLISSNTTSSVNGAIENAIKQHQTRQLEEATLRATMSRIGTITTAWKSITEIVIPGEEYKKGDLVKNSSRYKDLCCLLYRTREDRPLDETERFLRNLIGTPFPSKVIEQVFQEKGNDFSNIGATEYVITTESCFNSLRSQYMRSAEKPFTLTSLVQCLQGNWKLIPSEQITVKFGNYAKIINLALRINKLLPNSFRFSDENSHGGVHDLQSRFANIDLAASNNNNISSNETSWDPAEEKSEDS